MRISILFLAIVIPYPALGANIYTVPIPDLPLINVPSASATQQVSSSGSWRISLGGGISYAPNYEGAANYRLRFMPLLEANYNDGRFFISVLRGLGYNFSEAKNAQYGFRLTPGHNRKQSADPHLNGMGDIGYIPEAGVFLNLRFAPWYVSSGINTGSHGNHAELGGGIGFPVSTSDRLRFGVNLNWGDNKYNQTYFGVTTEQSIASGNVVATYYASAGIMDYAFTANWMHDIDKAWFSSTGLSYKLLTGSAEHSPLTQSSNNASMNFLLGYRF